MSTAYNDITPRVGVAYDVFGNGKTALKFNWGRYLAYAANDAPYTSTNPGATVVRNVINRPWTDNDRDYVVDCNLLNPAAQSPATGTVDTCAAASGTAPNFGKLGAATQVDPGVLSGWGVRPHDYQTTITVQQELIPRVSADFSYTHRTFHGFFVTDDLTRRGNINSFYETYTLTAPVDSRLPDGGGYPITRYLPTPAALAVAPQLFLTRENGPRRRARQHGTVRLHAERSAAQRPDDANRHGHAAAAVVNTCETATLYNQVNAAPAPSTVPTRAGATKSSRGRRRCAAWRATPSRGSTSWSAPWCARSRRRSWPGPRATTAQWQVPNSVIIAALGHSPPVVDPDGHHDRFRSADNDHAHLLG